MRGTRVKKLRKVWLTKVKFNSQGIPDLPFRVFKRDYKRNLHA